MDGGTLLIGGSVGQGSLHFVGLTFKSALSVSIRGADLSKKGAGPFTPRAEVWNGRCVSWTISSICPLLASGHELDLGCAFFLIVCNSADGRWPATPSLSADVPADVRRLAMVAFAALILVETFKAGPGLVP